MAVVWIVTTGNSDVKLDSDYGWGDLRTKKNNQLKPCHKKGFGSLIKGDDNLFSLPARAMGIIYGDTWETHELYFKFPLLEEFIKFIKRTENESKHPDYIIILLTNQERIFLDDSDDPRYDRTEDSPYWRDTSRLEPVFKKYFDREFRNNKVQFSFSVLEPEARQRGLDNWDSTLKLVQKEFEKWSISESDCVIVSHQASTPAISSAVQFVSLAKFGNKVNFLIANERDSDLTRFLEGSEYLKGIRKKEAEALLRSYNYAGIEVLLKDELEHSEEVKTLFNAAKNWNVAKFGDFLECLKNYPKFASDVEDRKSEKNWWWIAYEEAYLAVIRKEQDNIVEAFFHSFRAFEYIFAAWSDHEFGISKGHIEREERRPYLKDSVLSDAKDYFSKAKFKQNGDPRDDLAKLKHKIEKENKVLLDLATICKLFRACRGEYKAECPEIEIFWDQRNNKEKNVSEKRDIVFHQVEGMSKSDLWDFWDISFPEGAVEAESKLRKDKLWQDKLLEFLNFIVKEDLSEGFESLQDASLMEKVHQELEKTIAQL